MLTRIGNQEEIHSQYLLYQRESKYHFSGRDRSPGLFLLSAPSHPPKADSGLRLKNTAELTVARQPMIHTWFPIKPLLRGISIFRMMIQKKSIFQRFQNLPDCFR
jgi:hypothetical protein